MKKFSVILCFVFVLICFAGQRFANAAYYTDYYDAGDQYMSWGDSITWTFDITNDGFDPATEDIEWAEVVLTLTDDSAWDWWEFAALDIEGSTTYTWEVDTGQIAFNVQSLTALSETGQLQVTLTSTFGDFIFNSATLNANSNGSPVPEPATMCLFGFGLLGLVGIRKFRR